MVQCDCSGLTQCNILDPADIYCPRDDCGRVCYDQSCQHLKDYDCLRNPLILDGPKVVSVNLDNRCQVERLEREGIFLDIGDILIVTGRENDAIG